MEVGHREIEWFLTSPLLQSVALVGLPSEDGTIFEKSFNEVLPIYYFEAKEYNKDPRGLIFVSPDANISFRILSDQTIICHANAFVFGIIPWNEQITTIYQKNINFEVSSSCQICENLTISRNWIRLCPYIYDSQENFSAAPVTSIPTTKATSAESTIIKSTSSSTVSSITTEIIKTAQEPSIVSSTTSSIGDEYPKLQLSDDLRGMYLDCGYGDMSDFGLIGCNTIFDDISLLGDDPTCEGYENGIFVLFGKNATLQPGDRIQFQQCTPSLSHLNFGTLSADLAATVNRALSPIHPSFTVSYPNEILSCDPDVIVEAKQIQGNGDRDLTFMWDVVNGSKILPLTLNEEKSRRISFPGQLITDNITLTVRGCNYGGLCSREEQLEIRLVHLPAVFKVHIAGVPQVVYPSSLVRLQAVPELTSCNVSNYTPKNLQYQWFINNTFVSEEDNYRIPSYKYLLGEHIKISLKVKYNEINSNFLYEANATEILTYTTEPLFLSLDSALYREIPVDRAFTLDASSSHDYNSVDSILSHQWSCTIVSPQKKSNCSIGMTNMDWTQPVLWFNSYSLNQGTSYQFVDKITSSNGLSGELYTQVTATETELPWITVQSMKEKEDINTYVRVQAFIASTSSPVSISWQVLQTNWTGWFDIKQFLSQNLYTLELASAKPLAVSLTIPPKSLDKYPKWTGLKQSTTYIIRLLASNIRGQVTYDIYIKTTSPPNIGKVEVTPSNDIVALTTPVNFEVGDGWENTESEKMLYRFAITSIHKNETKTMWMPQSSSKLLTIYLPSAWPDHPSCGNRIGYRATLEACYERTCRIAESPIFYVAPAPNQTLAVVNMLSLINADIMHNNLFSALAKVYALELETCEYGMEQLLVDQTLLELLSSIDSTSTSLEYREVLYAASTLVNYVSVDVVEKIFQLLQNYRNFIGKMSSVPGSRRRRKVQYAALSSDEVNENEASTLLEIADNVLYKNMTGVVDMYFITIEDFLNDFCKELGGNSDRIMTATGKLYTIIQTQSINSNVPDFLSLTFKTAGSSTGNLAFMVYFSEVFKQYSCGNNTTCDYVCLATAKINRQATVVNKQFYERLLGQQHSIPNLNNSVSDFYSVVLKDPLSGNNIDKTSSMALYSIKIPITNYKSSSYYGCYIYQNVWSTTSCTNSDFAVASGAVSYLECQCTSSGIIGVFELTPPQPVKYPSYKEVKMYFNLSLTNNSDISSIQLNTFIIRLSWATGLTNRLVNGLATNSSFGQIALTLRPPFNNTQLTNSYAIQAITRAVNATNGFKAFDNVTVVNTTFIPIDRDLRGDTNARKLLVTLKNPALISNNSISSLSQLWIAGLSSSLRISPYRLKNVTIFDSFFNITITIPFKEEKQIIQAEEIAAMIMEQIQYKEIVFQSLEGEPLLINKLTNNDVIMLLIQTAPNALALALIIVVSTVVFCELLIVGGAVIIKIRTERLIEIERRRVIVMNPGDSLQPPAPQDGRLTVANVSQNVRHR